MTASLNGLGNAPSAAAAALYELILESSSSMELSVVSLHTRCRFRNCCISPCRASSKGARPSLVSILTDLPAKQTHTLQPGLATRDIHRSRPEMLSLRVCQGLPFSQNTTKTSSLNIGIDSFKLRVVSSLHTVVPLVSVIMSQRGASRTKNVSGTSSTHWLSAFCVACAVCSEQYIHHV